VNHISKITDLARSPGDPEIIKTGKSSRTTSDNMAKRLGWFSLALGLTELLAARQLARALGVEGRETLIRTMGAREIAHGVTCLSTEQVSGVWSRVAGDALDVAALLWVYNDRNPKKHNVGLALAAVLGITLLDLATADALTLRHARGRGQPRDYSDRSGWPNGERRARGAAADFQVPADFRDTPAAAGAWLETGRTSVASAGLDHPQPTQH
jgi:hypothetical protein